MSDGMQSDKACEICSSARVLPWATVDGYIHYRCGDCRHLYINPRPSPDAVDAYYRDATFYDKAESEEARLVSEARGRIRTLGLLAEGSGLERRLLDVGCASGIFLQEARRAGWTAEGVELSPVLSTRAMAKGLEVKRGRVESLPAAATYPVVTAWEVIEHAVDPVEFFRHLCARVRPGGLLAVSTPRSDGLPATLLRTRFPMIRPPEHLSLFSRRSLALLGVGEGLQELAFRSFSNIKRQNLARGLSRMLLGRVPGAGSVTFGVSSLLALVLAPLPPVMDALGLGTEMEIVFRRPAQQRHEAGY